MKNIFKIGLITLLALQVQSCNYNDLEPWDFVGDKDAFSSAKSVEEVTIGAYSRLSLRTLLTVSEFASDNVYQGGQFGGLGDVSYQWSYTSSNGDHSSIWSQGYAAINEANRILEKAPAVKTENDADKVSLNNSLGACYFIRAYSHFVLLEFFSDCSQEAGYGVPYIKKSHTTELPGRNSVKECFDFMLEDLTFAESLLKDNAPSNPSFVSKAAVHALRARVYEFRGNWTEAYNSAEKALELVPDVSGNDYKDIWSDKTDKGLLFRLKRLAGSSYIGTLFYQADNSIAYGPSDSYLACLSDKDIRKNLFTAVGPDRDGLILPIVVKYPGPEDARGRSDEKILRSSEMVLIQIEALLNQNGKLGQANNLLNSFRKSRIDGYTDVTYTKEQMVEELLLERRRELAFEGHRFFDLRRYGKDIERGGSAKLSDIGYFKYLMPIPHSEIVVNKNIKEQQNKGY